MSVVDGVVTLEVEETCRTTHRAHRRDEGVPLAGVEDGTCGVCMHADVDPLPINDAAFLLRVGKGLILCCGPHKLILPCRACVVAPKSFEINGANVAPAPICAENAVDLLKILCSGLIIVAVAAAKPSRLDIILTGTELAKLKGLRIDMIRHELLIEIVPASSQHQLQHHRHNNPTEKLSSCPHDGKSNKLIILLNTKIILI